MPLNCINKNPKCARTIIEDFFKTGERFYLADVGSAMGVWSNFNFFLNSSIVYAFEPQDDSHQAPISDPSDKKIFHFSSFLSCHNKMRKFYFTNLSLCSGFYQNNKRFCNRLPNNKSGTVLKSKFVKTKTIDSLVSERKLRSIDFIKIDCEGGELDVLKGSEKQLSNSISGIFTEFWLDPIIKNQPSFAEIDSFLRSKGFSLFDMSLDRYPKKTLPVGILNEKRRFFRTEFQPTCLFREHGQILTGDALYFKDPIKSQSNEELFDKTRILKLIAFYDFYNYQDCALELLFYFKDRYFSKKEIKKYTSLLISSITTKPITYTNYYKLSKKFFEKLSNTNL